MLLLALRHARPEIDRGAQRILCDDDSAVLCILRDQGARKTLLLVNLGKRDARPSLDPASVRDTAWTDLLDASAPASPAIVSTSTA